MRLPVGVCAVARGNCNGRWNCVPEYTTCFSLYLEQVFLKNLEAEQIYQRIKRKLANHEDLSEEELMQLIILPLTEMGKENKQKRIEQVIELAIQMEEDAEQAFVIAGVMVSSDKFINREYADKVRRWLKLTKVGRIFEEEKLEALRELETDMKKKFAQSLLAGSDMDVVDIMKHTGLSRKEIEQLLPNNATEYTTVGRGARG